MAKTVLITGSSKGMGRETVKFFHQKGWNVAATMRSPEKENELNKLDGVVVCKLDVTDRKSIIDAIDKTIEIFGSVDLLVNNAGYGAFGFLETASEKEINSIFDTNVTGVMRMIQEVLPHMRKQREGCIINITSIVGRIGSPMLSLYGATKFAVEGLTEALVYELGEYGIDIKSLAPGGFSTGFQTSSLFTNGRSVESLAGPMKTLEEFTENRRVNSQLADPKIVAEKVYSMATTKTPVKNIIGKDIEMLMGMKQQKTEQEIIEVLKQMAMPKFDLEK